MNPPYASQKPPRRFASDGCTCWPDGDWVGPCRLHDTEYYQGGSWIERLISDVMLARNVIARATFPLRKYPAVVYPIVAAVMFIGVRFGGGPYFHWLWKICGKPNTRWGYGWNWPRYGPREEEAFW